MKKVFKILLLICLTKFSLAQTGANPSLIQERKILREEVVPRLYEDSLFKVPGENEPEWKKIERNLTKVHKGLLIKWIILNAKLTYYRSKKQWNSFANCFLTNLEKYEKVENMTRFSDLSVSVNNNLYDNIFKHVSDRKLLDRAAIQAKKVLDNPNSVRAGRSRESELSNAIDTYANLLYKAGKIEEAINWQQKAVAFTNGKNPEFKNNLIRMQKGESTWEP